MSARNVYHDAVVDALVADGWTITHDPFTLSAGYRHLFVDLAAERPIGAARGADVIAVEVQSFIGDSDIENLHRAVGQYVVYRALLENLHPERRLYLGIPEVAFQGIFSEQVGQLVRRHAAIRLAVFHPTAKRIVRWIN